MAADDYMAVEIPGLQGLVEKLRSLPPKLARSYARKALRAGGNIIRDEARARVPTRTHTLRKSIAYTATTSLHGSFKGKVYIKHGKKAKHDGYYAHMVEFGTKAHLVKARQKRVLSNGRMIFGRAVWIPAIGAHPFMRPAAETKAREAVDAMASKLAEFFKTEARG